MGGKMGVKTKYPPERRILIKPPNSGVKKTGQFVDTYKVWLFRHSQPTGESPCRDDSDLRTPARKRRWSVCLNYEELTAPALSR